MPKIESAGRQEVTVKSSQFGESETGTPFFNLLFENDAGEYIGGWLYLSENAFKNSLKTLRETFGFDGNFETLSAQVDGKRCSITAEFEEFNGDQRLKVKWINPCRAPVKPIEGGTSFLKKLTDLAARTPVESRPAAKSTATKAPAPAKAKADDIPPF